MLGSGYESAAMAQSTQKDDLVRFKLQMDGLKNRLAAPDQEKKLKDTCVKFEAVFLGQLWKEMRKSVPKEGYLHSPMEEQYLSMFDKQFSEHLAQNGGVGLADMLYDQLKQQVEQTAHRTLGPGKEAEGMPLEKHPHGMPLAQNQDEQGVALDPHGAAARLWDSTRRQADPAQARAEVLQQVEALARRIVSEGGVEQTRTAARQAARSYGQEAETGRHIAKKW